MISKEEEKNNEIPEFNKKSARNEAATTECIKNCLFCTIVPNGHGITPKCFFERKNIVKSKKT